VYAFLVSQYSEKICPGAIFSTTNILWTVLGLNPTYTINQNVSYIMWPSLFVFRKQYKYTQNASNEGKAKPCISKIIQ
jgi:hypothetical protein